VKPTILFTVAMLMLLPATNAVLTGRLGTFGAWLGAWAPFSYLIVALVLAAPVAAIQMMLSWPKHVEPENPMAKYRRESPPDVE